MATSSAPLSFGLLAGGSSDPRPSGDSIVFIGRGSTKAGWARALLGLGAALGLAALLFALFIEFQVLAKLSTAIAAARAELTAEEATFATIDSALQAEEPAFATAAQDAATAATEAAAADALSASALAAVTAEQSLVDAATAAGLAALSSAEDVEVAAEQQPMTLHGATILSAFNGMTSTYDTIFGPLSPTVTSLFTWVLVKIGKIVTLHASPAYAANPFGLPTDNPPFNILLALSGGFTTGAGGTQPSDQNPSGPPVSWMPAATAFFDIYFADNTSSFPEFAVLEVSPNGGITIDQSGSSGFPPGDAMRDLPSFSVSWTSAF